MELRGGAWDSRPHTPPAARLLPAPVTHPHGREAGDVEVSADGTVGLISTVQGSEIQGGSPV